MIDKENFQPNAGKSGIIETRKSLSWNDAFLTEEGVLNPLELSVLSGGFVRSSDSLISGTGKGLLSPSSFRSKLCCIEEETLGSRAKTTSRTKVGMIGNLSESNNSSTHAQINTSREMTNGKGTSCSPAYNSQKRMGNASIRKPAKKIPKLREMASKPPKPPTGSIPPVHTQAMKRGVGSKTNPSGTKKDSNPVKYLHTSLGKNMTHQASSSIVPQGKITKSCSVSSLPPKQAVSSKVSLSSSNVSGSTKSEIPPHQAIDTSQLPISFLGKPSSLRKPSPALGFFLQGKYSSPNIVGDRITTSSLDEKLPNVGLSVAGSIVMNAKEVNESNNSVTSKIPNNRTKLKSRTNLNSALQPPVESDSKAGMVPDSSAANSKCHKENEKNCPALIKKVACSDQLQNEASLDSDRSEVELHQSSENDSFNQLSDGRNSLSCIINPKNNERQSSESESTKIDYNSHRVNAGDNDLVSSKKGDSLAKPVKKTSMYISMENQVPVVGTLKAEPFTDEWIAAVEALGEDILKMKGGAVQNSPTNKAPPEPSPWSPVKRKNQDIGPYDCTKYNKK